MTFAKANLAVRILRVLGSVSLPRFAARHGIALLQWIHRVLATVALWICSKKHFWTVVSLGLAAAYLCRTLPVVGSVLAILLVALSMLHGFALQVASERRQRFRDAYQSQGPGYYDDQMM